MTQSSACPQCGTVLAPESAQGLCPRCLIALNLTCATEVPDDPDATDPEPRPGKRPPAPAPAPEEIAKYFPELEIVELLGRGGMGAVYKARQRRLDRLVALKILPPTVSNDPSFAERFTREAQALAKLNHPHIVTLYEFGQTEGLFYFLMEYVDGVNLRQLVNVGRLKPAEALAIVPQICDALQYAHERGIVHRDIKPENLLLSKEGRLKIADFGVAKLVADRWDPMTGEGAAPDSGGCLTQPRGVLGTPQYMAPEQVSRPLEVDHRADIYSLGVVFYQMLTGELPAGKFDPPSKKVVIDVRLDQVVLRALEKQPERRYQQVSDVKNDVETIAHTALGPDTVRLSNGRARSTSTRRAARMRVSLLAAAGVVAVLGLLGWIAHAKRHAGHKVGSGGIEGWEQRAPANIKGRSSAAAVWTGKEMLVFGGEGLNVSFGDGGRYDLEKDEWSPLPLEGAAPSARTCATAVWTGEAFIIWGGFGGSYAVDINRNDGARFHARESTWRPVATVAAPEARFGHTAVWTGNEMLVWGGFDEARPKLEIGQGEGHYLNTGGRYDPATNAWRQINTSGAPSPRIYHSAFWTGKEMLVWGGGNAAVALNDGGRYDPSTDTWKPLHRQGAPSPRIGHMAVWTGKEMVVWGGSSREPYQNGVFFQDGACYNPETDTWRPMNTRGAPKARTNTQAVWTGSEMIVWGGSNDAEGGGVKDPNRFLGTGARYNPATDTWTDLPTAGAPTPRLASAMVWTGEGLLVFGGWNGKHLNDTWFLSLKR